MKWEIPIICKECFALSPNIARDTEISQEWVVTCFLSKVQSQRGGKLYYG